MALINCPECNKEVSDQAVACPNCGFVIKPVKVRAGSQKKAKIISVIIVSLIIFVSAGIFVGYQIYNSSLEKERIAAVQKVEEERLAAAQKAEEERISAEQVEAQKMTRDKYLKILNVTQIIVWSPDSVGGFGCEIEWENVSGKTMKATSLMKKTLLYYDNQTILEKDTYLEELKVSKDSYNNAVQSEKRNDIEAAYSYYKQVIENDINFAVANQKTEALKTKIIDYYLNKSELAAFKHNNYEEAYSIIDDALAFLPQTKAFLNMKEKIILDEQEYKEKLKKQSFFNEIQECPLQIEYSHLGKNAIENPTVSVTVKNESSKTVNAFIVNFYLYDNFNKRVNHYLYDTNIYTGINQKTINPDKKFNGNNYYWTPYGHENTMKFIAVITEIHYTDNTTWQISEDALEYAQIYADEKIANIEFK